MLTTWIGGGLHATWFNFVVLQVVARVIVPILFLMAAHDFFLLHRDKKELLQGSLYLVKRGIVLYIIYASLYLTSKYLMPAFFGEAGSLYGIRFLRGIIAGEAPCSWMILSFLVGVVLVAYLVTIQQRPVTILIISFLLHTVSIFTEIYFYAIMHIDSAPIIWSTYYKFFVTTRNGLFYGFFWCMLGYILSFARER